jgi:hypothetical protein
MRSRGLTFAGGVAFGAVAGWVIAQRRLESHRRDLFSTRPLRRLAALGFLAGQNGVETVRLLRDYLAWERQPMLRRRAEAIVRRMEATLR